MATPHFHSSIELLFCVEGQQELIVAGERRVLKKGDACFINSYVVHSLQKADCNMFVFLGDCQFFQPIFRAFGDKVPPQFFRFEDEALLSLLHDVCLKNKENNDFGTVESREIFEGAMKILMASIANFATFEKNKGNKQSDLVTSILQYTTENISSDISLKTLATKFGYSHEHLSRILHHLLGEHWSRYIGRLRAREADRLLKKFPSASVLEVAAQCGFESPNTFYRAYQREFGKPPRS